MITLQACTNVPLSLRTQPRPTHVDGPPRDPLTEILVRHFGLSQFRPWQREAIDALLAEEGRVLVVAPTGGGKSLCYQLPALALEGTALVLSPLISLMDDQVRALEARGISATYFASSLSREENGKRLSGLRRGAYKIVYAAPERLALDGFLDALASSRLSLAAVDEAHCIVQWGHDFRPDYLRIGEALARLSPPRVLACTATATPEAREEIIRRLGWAEHEPRVVLRGFARPNLHLSAQEVSGPREAAEVSARALVGALGSATAPAGAAIVYSATRRGAEGLADKLRAKGFSASAYHAGLDAAERARVAAAFAARELPVVVATNAFGMGIDRPDVRVVVHAQPPSSLEGYYQEVGRAGRDGAPAEGLLLFSGSDIALRRRLCMLESDGAPASAADAARAWGLFRELLRYVDAGTCRHDFILRYFGDEAESLGGCGHCDVCRAVAIRRARDPESLARDRDVIRRALAGVARAKGHAGMQAVAAMLSATRSARIERLGLDRLSTFGALAQMSAGEVMGVLRVLLANGWIDLTTGDYPMPLITKLGWRVMKDELAVEVDLPLSRSMVKARLAAARSTSGALSAPSANAGDTAVNGGAVVGKPASTEAIARAETRARVEADPAARALFEALRTHRAALARDKDVPAYVIAPDRTLAEMALARPRTERELEAVHGMGAARIAAYGEGFLGVIRQQA